MADTILVADILILCNKESRMSYRLFILFYLLSAYHNTMPSGVHNPYAQPRYTHDPYIMPKIDYPTHIPPIVLPQLRCSTFSLQPSMSIDTISSPTSTPSPMSTGSAAAAPVRILRHKNQSLERFAKDQFWNFLQTLRIKTNTELRQHDEHGQSYITRLAPLFPYLNRQDQLEIINELNARGLSLLQPTGLADKYPGSTMSHTIAGQMLTKTLPYENGIRTLKLLKYYYPQCLDHQNEIGKKPRYLIPYNIRDQIK